MARRGYVEQDLVIGDDMDEAEAAYFHRHRLSEPTAKDGDAGEPAP
jgi:hypothetical protein